MTYILLNCLIFALSAVGALTVLSNLRSFTNEFIKGYRTTKLRNLKTLPEQLSYMEAMSLSLRRRLVFYIKVTTTLRLSGYVARFTNKLKDVDDLLGLIDESQKGYDDLMSSSKELNNTRTAQYPLIFRPTSAIH